MLVEISDVGIAGKGNEGYEGKGWLRLPYNYTRNQLVPACDRTFVWSATIVLSTRRKYDREREMYTNVHQHVPIAVALRQMIGEIGRKRQIRGSTQAAKHFKMPRTISSYCRRFALSA
jgi:hypothetical protein